MTSKHDNSERAAASRIPDFQSREEEAALLERDKKLLLGDAHVYYHRGQLLFHLDRIDEAREHRDAAF